MRSAIRGPIHPVHKPAWKCPAYVSPGAPAAWPSPGCAAPWSSKSGSFSGSFSVFSSRAPQSSWPQKAPANASAGESEFEAGGSSVRVMGKFGQGCGQAPRVCTSPRARSRWPRRRSYCRTVYCARVRGSCSKVSQPTPVKPTGQMGTWTSMPWPAAIAVTCVRAISSVAFSSSVTPKSPSLTILLLSVRIKKNSAA